MIHWEEGENERGSLIWFRYIDCGPWGLILTGTMPRWIYAFGLNGNAIAGVVTT